MEEVPRVKIFRFDSPLIFTNAESLKESLYKHCGIDEEVAYKWQVDKENSSSNNTDIHNAANEQASLDLNNTEDDLTVIN